jgi:hypothetical protein
VFLFDVRRSGSSGAVSGQLFAADPKGGFVVVSDTVSTLTLEGATASFSGTCTDHSTMPGGSCTFIVKAEDGGPRGVDFVTLEVAGGGSAAGRVVAGDVRVSGASAP